MPATAEPDKLRRYDHSLNAALLMLTIAVIAVGYFTIFRPIESQLVSLRQQTAERQELVQKASAISQTNRTLTEQLAKTTLAAGQMEQRIPTAPRESDFLAQICQLADRVGMEVVDYQNGAIQTLENHREMEVKLNTRGEYEPLCKFLEQVDQVPRLCRLTNLDIASEPTGGSLSIVLTFRIYFSPPTESTLASQGQI